MAFSAVGITKVKKEMDVSGEAEHAVTPPSPNSCNGYEPVMYSVETRDQRQSIYLQRHFPNQTQEGPLQSKRVLLNEASRGAGRATHDFLSLYGGIPSHFVEPNANRGASSSLTTQDLLQPLERGNSPKFQESKSLHSNKPTKGESLSQHGSVAAPVPDHLLPNCVSSTPMNASMEISQMQLLRLAGVGGNPQGIRCEPQMSLSASHDEHLLLESMRSSDLTVEQEHVETHKCWSNARAEYALPDLLYATNGSLNHGTLDGCYQPLPPLSRHWQKANQPFVELIKHSKVPSGDEEDEVEGLDHAKEQSEYTSMDGKSTDKRATTPRSKHSATEQRRRSKINDRFQMLRNLVPHSDQKRDKASFLLEVIHYVQVLQEKVRKYEGIEQGRHQERLNNLVWESCKKTAVPEAFVRDATAKDNTGRLKNITSKGLAVDVKPFTEIHDRRPRLLFSQSAHESGALPADLYPHVRQQSTPHINVRSAVITNEIDASPENYTSTRVIPKICSSLLSGQHDLQATVPAPDSQTICSLSRRCMDELPHLREESTSAIHVTEQSQAHFDAKHQRQSAVEPRGGRSAVSMDSLPVLENSVAPVNAIQGLSGGTFGPDEIQIRTTSHADSAVPNNKEEIIPYVLKNKMDTPATHIRDESLAVTGGIISVSSIYSQELLNALTHALQSSGLDLSQANISVQIDLGKRVGDSKTISSDEQTIRLTPESSSQSQQSNGHPRPAGPHSESNLPCKKPKVRDDWLG